MAKFPVELDDDEGQRDAINYLLSGPAGLGQNFSGFSAFADPTSDPPVPYGYLTGNFRKPYSQPTEALLYVPDISLSNAEVINDRTIKYTFSSTQASPPFSPGMGIYISGVDPSSYDTSDLKAAGLGPYNIGVVECTTDYVAIRTSSPITTPLGTYVSGGAASYSSTGGFTNSTDCNARCTVSGGTDKVFIAGQLDNLVSYTLPDGGTGTFYYNVSINRYKGVLNNDPINPDYIFNFDGTVALKQYTFESLTGTGTLPLQETVFASIFDQPPKGYYWYIMEVQFDYDGDLDWIEATQAQMGLRSLSVQVVKQ